MYSCGFISFDWCLRLMNKHSKTVMTARYDTAGNPEDEYYPTTSVLINLEDIRDPEELLERETELQLAAYEAILSSFNEGLTPDLPFFYYFHHLMFGPLFVWAGRPRTVGIAKEGTPFCPRIISTR